MKRIACLLGICLVTAPVSAIPVEEAIDQIRADYNRIESADLRSETFRWAPSDDPAEGTLTRYYLDDELVKIDFSFSEGDHGGADETYYYSQGDLFFVFVHDSSWAFTGKTLASGESETVDTFREHRLYFQGNHLLRYLLKEARSRDPAAAAEALAGAENQAHHDPAFSSAALGRALRAPNVMSAGEIEGLLFDK